MVVFMGIRTPTMTKVIHLYLLQEWKSFFSYLQFITAYFQTFSPVLVRKLFPSHLFFDKNSETYCLKFAAIIE